MVDVKSGRFMYQSGRVGDEAKKRKAPAKSGRVGITVYTNTSPVMPLQRFYSADVLSFGKCK